MGESEGRGGEWRELNKLVVWLCTTNGRMVKGEEEGREWRIGVRREGVGEHEECEMWSVEDGG